MSCPLLQIVVGNIDFYFTHKDKLHMSNVKGIKSLEYIELNLVLKLGDLSFMTEGTGAGT